MNKIILIAIAMIAMIGIVQANPYDAAIWDAAGNGAAPQPINIKPGDSLTLSYHGANIIPDNGNYGYDLAYNYEVVALGNGAQVSDITVTTPINFTPTGATYTDVGAIQLDLNSSALVGATYRVTISAGDQSVDIEFGSASRNVASIPEFPTIALPIAAILGLAFIFQRRKEEE